MSSQCFEVRRGLKGEIRLGERVTEILGGSGITNANTLVFGYPIARTRCFCRSNTGAKVGEETLKAETEQTQRTTKALAGQRSRGLNKTRQKYISNAGRIVDR